jgi:hypothetical protein
VRNFTEAETQSWPTMIGKRVWKNPKTTSTTQPKPFKSGSKVNTVTGIVVHEQTGRPGFTFLEDASVVECFRCSLAPEEFKFDNIGARGTSTRLDLERFDLEIRRVLAAKAATPDSQRLLTYQYEGIILKGGV